jgi:hypothetical protein
MREFPIPPYLVRLSLHHCTFRLDNNSEGFTLVFVGFPDIFFSTITKYALLALCFYANVLGVGAFFPLVFSLSKSSSCLLSLSSKTPIFCCFS